MPGIPLEDKPEPTMHGAHASVGGEGALPAAQVNMVVYDRVSRDGLYARPVARYPGPYFDARHYKYSFTWSFTVAASILANPKSETLSGAHFFSTCFTLEHPLQSL